jgi:flagellar biosynthesis anti-sigma factor FlgM
MKVLNPDSVNGTGSLKGRKTDKGSSSKPKEGFASQSTTTGKSRADTVSISTAGGQLNEIHKEVKQLPDIRTAEVERLSKMVKDGKYDRPSEEVADAIIKTVLMFG